MGGNAIKTVPVRRYNRDEYEVLADEVCQRLYEFERFRQIPMPNGSAVRLKVDQIDSCVDIPAYRKKETFGDADILYESSNPLSVEEVKNLFPETKEIRRNGDVVSFELREFQVDLIHTSRQFYHYAWSYFSWNDCGNLVGKIARKFGLKHGHRGLCLPLRDGDNMFNEVLITDDHNKTLEFLDLDVERFRAGFDTLEEMFEFVIASKYFDPEVYKLENVSHAGRVRDRKRTTYNAFLAYIDGKTFPGKVELPRTKNYQLDKVFEFFPNARKDFTEAAKDLALQKYIKTKFGGDLVRDLTGLEGKELGGFMKELRSNFFFQPDVLVVLSEEEISGKLKECFESYQR